MVNLIGAGTVCLSGELPGKLEALRTAGFNAAEFWRDDLNGQRDRPVREALGRMKVLDIGPLQNYAGAPPDLRAAKRVEAAAMLSEARYWDAIAVQVCAATHLRADPTVITADLRDLAGWAEAAGLEVWYEALSWSRWDNTLPAAYARVREVDRPNVKVVIDTWHHLVTGGASAYVRCIRPGRVGLVQLSDLRHEPSIEDVITVARNHRALPGDGYMTRPMSAIVRLLLDAGYTGAFSAEVMNHHLREADPHTAAPKIMSALARVAPIFSD